MSAYDDPVAHIRALEAEVERLRRVEVATLRGVADQVDSIGHHWSGAPAHAFFELAADLNDRADALEAR